MERNVEIKVLHVCEYTAGGVATYLAEVLAYQHACSEIRDVRIVMSDFKANRKLFQPFNPHYYRYKRRLPNFVRAIKEIYKVIRREKPDIIHVHSTFAGVFVRIPYLFKQKRPKIIYCAHGWSFCMDVPAWKKSIYALVERILAWKTDVIVNISNDEMEQAIHYKLPREKMRMIYNGIGETLQKAQIEPLLNKMKVNLLFVGRFDRQKGLDFLLNFWREHSNDYHHLYILGESILGDSKWELPTNVTCLGWVGRDEIDAYYEAVDAVIMPSRWEGFGLVAIEAMKNHTAVIAGNRGALPELVTHGHNGYIFDLEKPESLLEILHELDKEILRSMGENGYARFKEKFTSEQMNKAILAVYNEVN